NTSHLSAFRSRGLCGELNNSLPLAPYNDGTRQIARQVETTDDDVWHLLVTGRVAVKGTNFFQDLAGFDLAAFAPFEILRKISQNLSPAGVTSPFEARAMPTDTNSVVP